MVAEKFDDAFREFSTVAEKLAPARSALERNFSGALDALETGRSFDGMDVKCCHRYLACELLSAYTRPGIYGGSYENRTRFLKNAYRAAKSAITGDFFLTSRLNAYDGFV